MSWEKNFEREGGREREKESYLVSGRKEVFFSQHHFFAQNYLHIYLPFIQDICRERKMRNFWESCSIKILSRPFTR